MTDPLEQCENCGSFDIHYGVRIGGPDWKSEVDYCGRCGRIIRSVAVREPEVKE